MGRRTVSRDPIMSCRTVSRDPIMSCRTVSRGRTMGHSRNTGHRRTVRHVRTVLARAEGRHGPGVPRVPPDLGRDLPVEAGQFGRPVPQP